MKILPHIVTEIRVQPNKTSPDEYYERLRKQIKVADSVNDMIDIISVGDDKLKKEYKRTLNKRFKGKIKPSREYLIKVVNTWEHNYWEAQMSDYDYYGD